MDLTTFIDELRLAEMYDGAILRSDLDLQGWGSTHPVFEHVVSEYRPTSIVEVGSWKGASASHMAGLLRQYDWLSLCYLLVWSDPDGAP